MRKCIRGLTTLLFFCACVLWGLMVYYDNVMPEKFNVTNGKELVLNGVVKATGFTDNQGLKTVSSVNGGQYRSTISLFGVFPIKEVGIQTVKQPVVVVSGMPFGIKMYTDGVLVVGFSDVDTVAGPCNPARIAGLKEGDVVLAVNDILVSTNAELRQIIEESGGEYLQLRIRRDNLLFTVKFRAVLSATENRYRSGFWVRDSSAGIGILTFFDPETKVFGGLGHAVCDVDTDEKLPISTGEIVAAEIYGVEKGKNGKAGSLNGAVDDTPLGFLNTNSETGIYGVLTHLPRSDFKILPVAMKQQVKEGEAQIYTTVEGEHPEIYSIQIERIRYQDSSPTKNMVIRITDPALIEKTGGIVQGMSGSPIIQNGKLVGAVTHVLVNDPTKGYAIFAENMLETAQSVGEGSPLPKNDNKLKDAS